MHQPVSVCHQWSITGTPRIFSAQATVSGSARSPARNSVRRDLVEYFFRNSAFGSSFLIARKAVGAVNSAEILYSSIIRQKAPASGVPIGLPS